MGEDATEALRRDLYRRGAAPEAVERYEAAVGHRPEPAPEPSAIEASPTARRPVRRLVAAGVGVLAISAVAAAALVHPVHARSQAEPLVAGGPYAVRDREALSSLLDGDADPLAVVQAVQGSELTQLHVWDTRDTGVWLQEGDGDVSRRFDGSRPAYSVPRPFSIVVQCAEPARYRWTISGTTPERPTVHVLETAGSTRCGGTPTVATYSRPAGAVVRGFDFTIDPDVHWGMAFVYPTTLEP